MAILLGICKVLLVVGGLQNQVWDVHYTHNSTTRTDDKQNNRFNCLQINFPFYATFISIPWSLLNVAFLTLTFIHYEVYKSSITPGPENIGSAALPDSRNRIE